jgi:hypothetical protein
VGNWGSKIKREESLPSKFLHSIEKTELYTDKYVMYDGKYMMAYLILCEKIVASFTKR